MESCEGKAGKTEGGGDGWQLNGAATKHAQCNGIFMLHHVLVISHV